MTDPQQSELPVELPAAKHVAAVPHKTAYIVQFATPLTGVQLGAFADALAGFQDDLSIQQTLNHRSWVGVIPPGEQDDNRETLYALHRLFTPKTPYTGVGTIHRTNFGMEVLFSILNLRSHESHEVLDSMLLTLLRVPGVTDARRQGEGIVFRVDRAGDTAWLDDVFVEQLGAHVTLYNLHMVNMSHLLNG